MYLRNNLAVFFFVFGHLMLAIANNVANKVDVQFSRELFLKEYRCHTITLLNK